MDGAKVLQLPASYRGELPCADCEGARHQLDLSGRPIVSRVSHELTTDGALSPFEVAMRLGGDAAVTAGALGLTECLTGRTYPVSTEADFLAIECARAGVEGAAGQPLYVTFAGEIVQRPEVADEGTRSTIVVRQSLNAWPLERCGAVLEVSFMPGSSMRRSCPASLERLEGRFIASLAAAERWRHVGDALELLDAKGSRITGFEAADR